MWQQCVLDPDDSINNLLVSVTIYTLYYIIEVWALENVWYKLNSINCMRTYTKEIQMACILYGIDNLRCIIVPNHEACVYSILTSINISGSVPFVHV